MLYVNENTLVTVDLYFYQTHQRPAQVALELSKPLQPMSYLRTLMEVARTIPHDIQTDVTHKVEISRSLPPAM
jgi:hypothetical protein